VADRTERPFKVELGGLVTVASMAGMWCRCDSNERKLYLGRPNNLWLVGPKRAHASSNLPLAKLSLIDIVPSLTSQGRTR
jgi:hypothetical protein